MSAAERVARAEALAAAQPAPTYATRVVLPASPAPLVLDVCRVCAALVAQVDQDAHADWHHRMLVAFYAADQGGVS